MKLLSKITIKNLKLNKSRTIVTVVGIVLATALIIAVMGMVSSFYESRLQFQKEMYGDHHVKFTSGVPIDQLDKMKYNINVEKCYFAEKVNVAYVEDGEYKIHHDVIGLDKNSIEANKNMIIEGRMPENENEVAVVNIKGHQKCTVGTELESENEKIYTVVGLCSNVKMFIDSYVVTYLEEPIENPMVALRYKDPEKLQGESNKEVMDYIFCGIKDADFQADLNVGLLELEGSITSDQVKTAIYSIAILVILIVVLTSIFCIRNSFAISIIEKTQQYGMLASVGATSKQIRRNVLFEGAILGLIGIPLGILLGISILYLVVIIANTVLQNGYNSDIIPTFIVNINYILILMATLLSGIIIYFSSKGSARRASKMSEIEAIRGSDDIKIKAKNVKTPKFISKILGVGGAFALKNMKRNKRKFRITTVSLIVSVAMFVSLNSFTDLIFQSINEEYAGAYYNIEISYISSTIDADNLSKEISNMTQNNLCEYKKRIKYQVPLDYLSEFCKNTDYYYWEDMIDVNLVAFDDDYFLQHQKNIGIKPDIYQAILHDTAYVYDSENKKTIKHDTLDISSGIDVYDEDKKIIENLSLIRSEQLPVGETDDYIEICVSNTYFEEIVDDDIEYIYSVYVDSNDPYELEKNIDDYCVENHIELSVRNKVEAQKMAENMLLIASVFLYGFISVVVLIGLTNIFNSISSNMNLRRKEFATLQSIGMTKKEFNKMITFESAIYTIKSLLWGVAIGMIGSYLIYLAFKEAQYVVTYNIPTMQIVQCAVVVFIVIYGIMKSNLRKIAKQNIIETIRNENI